MHKLEALALAIAHQNQALEPGSEAFCNLNPGLLRQVEVFETRKFESLHAGYRALLANLQTKCSGQPKINGKTTHPPLGPTSTLTELCKTFRYLQVRKLVEFLQDALDDRAVNERTPLSFFMDIQ